MDRRKVNIVLRNSEHPCKIKGCTLKRRNGRCALSRNTFGMVDGVVDYSKCFDYTTEGVR